MGVRILQGDQPYDGACLYCSVSMWAFGPVFENADAAEAFIQWLPDDARRYTEQELTAKYHTWLEEVQQQQEEEHQEEHQEANQTT